jgi:hypothetical protein
MATPMLNCCSFQKGMYLPNGIGPTDSCPPIIQTVADISLAVDGTVTGQLTVERYIDGDGNQHIHLYVWDGATWVEDIGTSFRVEGGLITEMNIEIANTFEISVDGGVIWDNETITFDPPVASVETWFRNTVNGCVYTNLPIIPLEITYCVEYSLFDNSGDPTFLFGTINGADAGDAVAVAATYANWEGNTSALATYDNSTIPALIQIFRDSLTPPFVNFGTFQDILANPPVTIPIDTVSCGSNCYQSVFTVTDVDLDGVTALHSSAGANIDTDEIMFSDPTWAAQYLAICIAAGFLEPTATMTLSLNGNEVTLTICSVAGMAGGDWSNDDGSDSGTFTFTQL